MTATQTGPEDVFDAVDPETLLGEDHAAFESVLAGERPGPLSVVGPPYSGRGRVLDVAADRLDARRVRLDPGDGAATAVDALGDGPAVVGDCQHLFDRRVGGFEPLGAVLDAVAESRAPVVTGWNDTAWSYLAAVQHVERSIPVTAAIGPLSPGTMADALEAVAAGLSFQRDDPGAEGLVVVERRTVTWRGRELSVPVPGLNPTAVAAMHAGDDATPEEAVFERLARIADGNLGVGAALLRAHPGPVTPGDLGPVGADLDPDGEEAFCLRVLLGGERVEEATLRAVVGQEAPRIVGRFARADLVTTDAGTVALAPGAVPTATAVVEREGFL